MERVTLSLGGSNSVAFGRNTDAVNITLTGNGANLFFRFACHRRECMRLATADAASAGTESTTGLDALKRGRGMRCRLLLGPSIIRFPTRLTTYQA